MPRTTEQGHRAPCRHHQLGEQQRKAHSTENESDHIATRHRRSDENSFRHFHEPRSGKESGKETDRSIIVATYYDKNCRIF